MSREQESQKLKKDGGEEFFFLFISLFFDWAKAFAWFPPSRPTI